MADLGNARVSGVNHITLAVSDVAGSTRFYRDVLGMRLRARWGRGAYLEAGALWLALVAGRPRPTDEGDYSHIALHVEPDAFDALAAHIGDAGARSWQTNRSAGASLYFLDPDGHKLEIHGRTLADRLAAMRADPWDDDIEIF